MSVDFNDPAAWSFCKYCAFIVAVAVEDMPDGTLAGRMLRHYRRTGDWDSSKCYGSLLDPTEQPSPECSPVSWEEELVQAMKEAEVVVTDAIVTANDVEE